MSENDIFTSQLRRPVLDGFPEVLERISNHIELLWVQHNTLCLVQHPETAFQEQEHHWEGILESIVQLNAYIGCLSRFTYHFWPSTASHRVQHVIPVDPVREPPKYGFHLPLNVPHVRLEFDEEPVIVPVGVGVISNS